MAPEQNAPDPKVPLTGISGRESVFDKRLREFRLSGQFEQPNRKALQYIKKPTADFETPALDAKLRAKAEAEEEFTEIERMAFIDETSGFLNARTILSKLATEMRRAARYKRNLSMMIIELDPDSRKDHLSDLAKEMLFAAFCRSLQKNIREVDIIGRFDESSILIICPETAISELSVEAERLKHIIASAHFKQVGQNISLTASIGIASYPQNGSAPITILGAALEAAQQAVSMGGNRVCIAASDTQEKPQAPEQDFSPELDAKTEFERQCSAFSGQLGSEVAFPVPDVSTPIVP